MKQSHQKGISLRVLMRLFFLWVSFFFCLSSAIAQHYNFKNISTKDGLSSNLVYRVFEDQKGYFWYLTDKGISRFNGTSWKQFNYSDGYEDIGAFHIIQTANGVIWIITTNFKLYCFNGQKFNRVNTNYKISWVEADGNNVWALSRDKVLLKYDANGRQLKLIPISSAVNATMFFSFLKLPGERFLIATNLGIYSLNEHHLPELILASNPSTFITPRIFKRINGDLLLSNNIGVYTYNLKTKSLSIYHSLRNNELISMYENYAELYLGTFNGLFRISQSSDRVLRSVEYLKDNAISSIIRSQRGIFYFSTLISGVYRNNFGVLHINSEEGLKREGVMYIKKQKGNKYIFTKSGFVYRLNADNKDLKQISAKKIGETGKVYNIITVNDSQLLIGSNKFYLYAGDKLKELDSSQIIQKYFLLCYNKDTLYSPKLFDEISKKGKFKRYDRIINFIQQKGFRLKADHALLCTDKKVFFHTEQGLLEIEYNEQGIIDSYVYSGLDFISDVKVNFSGTIIVSTLDKGIYLIAQRKINRFSIREGLASDYCTKCYLQGNFVWVCTNKGVCKVTLNNSNQVKDVVTYSSNNYLLDDQVNDLAFDKQLIYVATDQGISYFNYNDYPKIKAPPVFIESISVNNAEISRDSLQALPYNKNNLNIRYSSPREWNENSLYKYVINSGDTLYTHSTELSYGSLIPGRYEIKIWGLNQNGMWSITPAVIYVTILQPFWKRAEFIISVAISLFSIVLLFIIRRINRIKERNKIQAQLIESELKALRLHMNPHFLFNTLNSLQKFILEHNPLEANKYISKFSKLMRWIMIYSDKQYLTLEEEFLFLDTYIELEQLRFDKIFKVVKTMDPNINPSQVCIPALVIQPFVENAIKYGITGISYEGELLLSFEDKQDYLLVTIQDNGVGRALVKQEQDLSGKEYESTGINYTNERLLLLLENKLNIENAVTITDLYDEKGVAIGTKVELIIPYYIE